MKSSRPRDFNDESRKDRTDPGIYGFCHSSSRFVVAMPPHVATLFARALVAYAIILRLNLSWMWSYACLTLNVSSCTSYHVFFFVTTALYSNHLNQNCRRVERNAFHVYSCAKTFFYFLCRRRLLHSASFLRLYHSFPRD